LPLFFSKTSRPIPLPLYSSQTPRKKLEKNGALAEPSAKEEVKTGIKKRYKSGTEMKWRSAVYKKWSWWDVCAWVWVRISWFNVIFSYIWYKRAKWKKERCWTMKKWNNQPHDNETVLLYRLKLFLCSAKGQLSFKISIIYHQLKFVVYVQVYLYTPKSGEQKIWKFKLSPQVAP